MTPTAQAMSGTISAFVVDRLRDALDEYGAELLAEMEKDISVPVQYVSGTAPVLARDKPKPIGNKPGPGKTGGRHRSGKVIRSKPGEPPRKEFGKYFDSFSRQTTAAGSTVTTSIGSRLPKRGQWLEFGTGNMKSRPHFTPLYLKACLEVVQKITSKL